MRIRAKRGTNLTETHIFDLVVGRSFFKGGFSDDLDAMREAWRSAGVRERVQSECRRRYGAGVRPFAEIAFDDMQVVDQDGAAVAREIHRSEREASRR